MRTRSLILAAGLPLLSSLPLLQGCSEPPPPDAAAPAPAVAAPEAGGNAPANDAAPDPGGKTLEIDAPAGRYLRDPNHSFLGFSVSHLGLSNYVVRFRDYTVELDLRPDELPASRVRVEVDPASVAVDYFGDYAATHPESPFGSWEEDLAQSPNFFNAGEHPRIRFESTRVEPAPDGTLKVHGELTLLGRTRPLTLDAALVGAMPAHPISGAGALGFSATGALKRSDFGMTHLVDPPLVGDEVRIRFEGELHQQPEDAAAPPAATGAD